MVESEGDVLGIFRLGLVAERDDLLAGAAVGEATPVAIDSL